jgi:prepilin-type N-terminal cleavage/methylation domain-containing protein
MKRRPIHGFTLVELLVVITIIGMLVGLLLPAVNMAREAGRRTVCENNLKQLVTSCRNHVDKLGFYPSGGWGSNWVGTPNAGTGKNQPGGWIYQLLPYMDNDALHDQGKGLTGTALTDADTKRVSTPIPALYCPTRRAVAAYPLASPNAGGTKAAVGSRTDYAINGGSVVIQHVDGPTPPSLAGAASYTGWPDLTVKGFNGIASFRSEVTDSMIPDSKGTTYLFGEKYLSPENYITGMADAKGNDPGDLRCAISGDDVSMVRWGNTSLTPTMDRIASNNPPPSPAQIFGSSHGAGWHAAFCDGHVQLVGWGILADIHQAMASRNGHEVVDPSKIPH